jgi:hypothetical protein
VIIQHGQRTDGRVPAFRTFEIHLPQLVGSAPFKSAGGLGVPVLIAHQIVTQQHTMDRIARQLHLFPHQEDLQFVRTPVGVALAHLDDALLQLREVRVGLCRGRRLRSMPARPAS